MSFVRAVAAIALSFLSFTAFSQVCKNPATMTAEEWRADLEVFRQQMTQKHGNLFHSMTSQEFNEAIDHLESKLPTTSSDGVMAALMKLVAMVHDGHTRLRVDTTGAHMLPIRLHFFADGLYVISGATPYSSLVGAKLIRIGRLAADEGYQAVRELVSVDGENEPRIRLLSSELLVTTEVLHAVGAIADSNSAEIVVEKDAKEIKKTLPAGSFRPWNNHGWPVDPAGWVDARSSSPNPPPIWLAHSDRNYWGKRLDNGKTLYIQFNQVLDDPKTEPIATFFPSLIVKAEQIKSDRIVLDLRLNGGVDYTLIRPIWHSLLKSQRFNQKGRLWVLIGPKTFSAAMNLVDELELNTNAMFAGEPTGETPNMWGDPTDVRLPNSCIVIRVSTLWWQFEDPRDRRSFRAPDRLIPFRHSDYANNLDPVIDSVTK